MFSPVKTDWGQMQMQLPGSNSERVTEIGDGSIVMPARRTIRRSGLAGTLIASPPSTYSIMNET